MTGFVLPLAFHVMSVHVMWGLYALHEPEDCKYLFLDFCLAAGCISLFITVVSVASRIIIEEAWMDEKLAEEEKGIVWTLANMHYFMIIAQAIMYGVFFIYLMIPYNKIDYDNKLSATYCSKQVYLTSVMLTLIFLVSVMFAVVIILFFHVTTKLNVNKTSGK